MLRFVILSGMGGMLCFAMLSCGTRSHVFSADAPLSLQALETLCGLPVPCGRPMACQDRMVTLRGYLDPANIYSRHLFPELPDEKFRLVDHRRHAIEVWAVAEDSRRIFQKLAGRPTDRIVVSGKLAAVDMPIAGQCLQGLKVTIFDASQIQFE